MTCLHCGGEMVRGLAPIHLDRSGVHLQLDAVPAWVCAQCGEALFDEAAVDSVQSILAAVDEQTERLKHSA